MPTPRLGADPCNLILTGVGGQGNVLASRLLGEMLTRRGYAVTIGETFGASQRGGSVMSHVRVSCNAVARSPQIPRGRAHLVAALEPIEGLRVLKDYGNPQVLVLCNLRPIPPPEVICGRCVYPQAEAIRGWIRELSARAWFLDTTQMALDLGHPILANVILLGALAGTGVLPLERADLKAVLQRRMAPAKVPLNMQAFDLGRSRVAAPVSP